MLITRWLQRLSHRPAGGNPTQDLWGRQRALSLTVDALSERMASLERSEALRAADHAAAMDGLQRLYRRVSARIARENKATTTSDEPNGETPLALRRRLGR